MLKANFTLSNGTIVSIEGTIEEVQILLNLYAGGNKCEGSRDHPDYNNDIMPKLPKDIKEKKTKPEEIEIVRIINLIKTCDEADAIEKLILDKTNEANRVLLPLLIISEHLDNAFGLTTTEISKITVELGVKVSRQNVLRALKFSASGFVMKNGNPARYTLNRRGLAYLKSVIAGSENLISETKILPKNLTPKKSSRNKINSTKKKTLKKQITELVDNGFFRENKLAVDVKTKLKEKGVIYTQSTLSATLLRLVRDGVLKRIKVDDIWVYNNL